RDGGRSAGFGISRNFARNREASPSGLRPAPARASPPSPKTGTPPRASSAPRRCSRRDSLPTPNTNRSRRKSSPDYREGVTISPFARATFLPSLYVSAHRSGIAVMATPSDTRAQRSQPRIVKKFPYPASGLVVYRRHVLHPSRSQEQRETFIASGDRIGTISST